MLPIRIARRPLGLRAASILGLSVLLGAAGPLEAPAEADLETPVADAAQANDVARVRALLQAGADVNAPQPTGLTALHWAALNGSQDIMDVLLYAGATLEPLTRLGGYTPLHLAARSGHATIVRSLLERGAEVDRWTSTGVTALHFAAQANDADAIRALVSHGAHIDALDGFRSRTPLVFAASRDATAAVHTLLELGADPSITTALKDYVAIAERDSEERAKRASVRAAQEGEEPEGDPPMPPGAEPPGNEPPDSTEAEPAEEEPAEEEQEAEPEEAEQEAEPAEGESEPEEPPVRALSSNEQIGVQGGFTPLHYAARQGHMETARILLDQGADINQPSSGDQSSPLLVAVINGNYDLARMLVERGADPNIVSDDGAGPLFATLNIEWSLRTWYPQPQMFRVQETSYLDLMKILLEAGADPNQRTSTHIWYAAYNAGRMGVDFTGATPFWRAAYATDVTAMRLLVEHGADPNLWTTKLPERQRFGPPAQEDEEEEQDPSGLPPIQVGGPAVHPIHAAAGVGFGTSRVAQQHRSVPDGWLPAMRYFVEELGIDPNMRDMDGYSPVHHAAARGDDETIRYLVSMGADVTLVSRRGQTTADMANSPEQRAQPHPTTIALLEGLGAKNNHNCQSCGTGGGN